MGIRRIDFKVGGYIFMKDMVFHSCVRIGEDIIDSFHFRSFFGFFGLFVFSCLSCLYCRQSSPADAYDVPVLICRCFAHFLEIEKIQHFEVCL